MERKTKILSVLIVLLALVIALSMILISFLSQPRSQPSDISPNLTLQTGSNSLVNPTPASTIVNVTRHSGGGGGGGGSSSNLCTPNTQCRSSDISYSCSITNNSVQTTTSYICSSSGNSCNAQTPSTLETSCSLGCNSINGLCNNPPQCTNNSQCPSNSCNLTTGICNPVNPPMPPVTINLIFPVNGSTVNQNPVDFTFNVSNASSIANCSLIVNSNTVNFTSYPNIITGINHLFYNFTSSGSKASLISCINFSNSIINSNTIIFTENITGNNQCNDNSQCPTGFCNLTNHQCNPCTNNSQCDSNSCNTNTGICNPIVCLTNINCGTPSTQLICMNNNSFNQFTTPTCSNNSCSNEITTTLNHTCSNGCTNGQCNPPITICTSNSDCGNITSQLVCQGSSIVNQTTTPTCSNNICSYPVTNPVLQSCPNACSSGQCVECNSNFDCSVFNTGLVSACNSSDQFLFSFRNPFTSMCSNHFCSRAPSIFQSHTIGQCNVQCLSDSDCSANPVNQTCMTSQYRCVQCTSNSQCDSNSCNTNTGICNPVNPPQPSDSGKYLWVANADVLDSSVSKIDTVTNKELARYDMDNYVSGIYNYGPTRIAIDKDGDAWVERYLANAPLVKIISNISRCIDRNHNGVIDTANASNDHEIIETSNTITLENDECIVQMPKLQDYALTYYGLAIDPQGFIWIGNYDFQKFIKIDPVTMQKVGEVKIDSFTYNAAVDSHGYLWTSNLFDGTFTKINTTDNSIVFKQKKVTVKTNIAGTNFTKTLRPWDIFINGNDIYFSISDDFTGLNNYEYLAMKVDSDGNLLQTYKTPGKLNLGRSLTVDNSGNLWVANPSTVVDWYKASTVDKFNTNTGALECSVSTNLTDFRDVVPYVAYTDQAGFIWAVNGLGNDGADTIGNAVKINPNTCSVINNTVVGVYPIPYSYHLY